MRSSTASPSRSRRLQAVALAWLVFALVAAQSLGLMHRVVHPGSLLRVGAPTALERSARLNDAPAATSGATELGLAGLFFGHDGKSACPLFDGLTGPAIAPAAILALAVLVVPNERLCVFAADFVARWAALFDARGPPDFR